MTVDRKIIAEIRESRVRMSNDCEHDPARFFERMKKFNENYAAQVERFHQKYKMQHVDNSKVAQ